MNSREDYFNNSTAAFDWIDYPSSLLEGDQSVNRSWFINGRLSLYENLVVRHNGCAIKYIANGSLFSLSFQNLDYLVNCLDRQISKYSPEINSNFKVAIFCSTGITSSLAALWCIFRGFKYLPLLTDITSSRFEYFLADFDPDIVITDSINVENSLKLN